MKNLDSVRCGVRYAAVPLTLAALAGVQRGAHQTPQHHRHDDRRPHHAGHELLRQSAGRNPNLDRLAREGMLFENCYVSNAISGPSRACILTGKYSHVNGFTDNSRTFDGDQQTFPKLCTTPATRRR